jgi:hypothetical protein
MNEEKKYSDEWWKGVVVFNKLIRTYRNAEIEYWKEMFEKAMKEQEK